MSSSNYIKNVALVGAGGNSGRHMAEALLKTGRHNVTAITRNDSKSQLAEGLKVAKVNYEEHESLVKALQGQDALVITLSGHAVQSPAESRLLQAAAEAKVPWVLPNIWSPDFSDKKVAAEAIVGTKQHKTIEEITKLGVMSYVAVACGFWYEWSLAIPAAYGFDLKNKEVTMFDKGETAINMSTWPQVGRAVAGLLSLPIEKEGDGACLSQFKNQFVYVSSFTVNQKDMLQSVLRITGAKESDWKISYEGAHERYKTGAEQMKNGDRMGFAKAMYTRMFFPDGVGNVENTGKKLSNDAIGLTEENMDDYTPVAIKRSETDPWG